MNCLQCMFTSEVKKIYIQRKKKELFIVKATGKLSFVVTRVYVCVRQISQLHDHLFVYLLNIFPFVCVDVCDWHSNDMGKLFFVCFSFHLISSPFFLAMCIPYFERVTIALPCVSVGQCIAFLFNKTINAFPFGALEYACAYACVGVRASVFGTGTQHTRNPSYIICS